MIKVMELVVAPPVLVAVTVNELSARGVVGVPEMTPVLVLKVRPAGMMGDIA
jgi:hypothetical protein